MGFKFWNLQNLIPTSCFYIAPANNNNNNNNNSSSNICHVSPSDPHDKTQTDHGRPEEQQAATRRRKKQRHPIKVITSCGVVLVYSNPIRASQLMLEHPTHLLCRSDSFCIGQKIPSLLPNKKLKRGHNYFLLPKPYFQTTLTFASAAASFGASAAFHNRNKSSTKLANSCRAFNIEKTKNGVLKIKVSDEFIAQLTKEQMVQQKVRESEEKVCSTPELMKHYTQLVESSRQWRPKLEPIREKEKRRFGSFRRIKKKKKKKKRGLQLQSAQMSPMIKSPKMLKNRIVTFRKK